MTAEKCFLILAHEAGPGPVAAEPLHLGRGEPGGVPGPVRWSPRSIGEQPFASETASPEFSWMCPPAAYRFCITRLFEAVFFKG